MRGHREEPRNALHAALQNSTVGFNFAADTPNLLNRRFQRIDTGISEKHGLTRRSALGVGRFRRAVEKGPGAPALRETCPATRGAAYGSPDAQAHRAADRIRWSRRRPQAAWWAAGSARRARTACASRSSTATEASQPRQPSVMLWP